MRFPPPMFRIPTYVVFRVNGVGVFLEPGRRTYMNVSLSPGHSATLSFTILDQNGNPFVTPPVPSQPPVWANTPSDPPIDTFTPAADGLSAQLVANAPGGDTVTLSLNVPDPVSGNPIGLTALLSVTISAAAQIPTSVVINSTVT